MNSKELKQAAARFERVFSSDDGKWVLTHLEQLFANRRSYVRGDPYGTAFNEGQRDAVGYIHMMLDQALELKPRRKLQTEEEE